MKDELELESGLLISSGLLSEAKGASLLSQRAAAGHLREGSVQVKGGL